MNLQKMKASSIAYIQQNRFKLTAGIAACVAAAFGALDAAAGMGTAVMIGDVEPSLKSLEKGMKDAFETMTGKVKEVATRIQDLEQKIDTKPGALGHAGGDYAPGLLSEHVMKSEGFAAAQKGVWGQEIVVPRAMIKAAILNAATLDNDQPLVQAQRLPGVVQPLQRRFTIRDLFPQLPTESNLIEFAKELNFTNNAGPQYDASSPDTTRDGAIKNESSITFQLANTPVITLAHWIPASRQILSDSRALQSHCEQRLMYGLKLKEETELLTGTGAAGGLNGLVNNATAFNRGATNITSIDAVGLAIGQLTASDCQPNGIILNPNDWYSTKFAFAKDTNGKYLLGEPSLMAQPQLWGLPVIITASMTQGQFMVLDAPRVGYIADRESAIIRIAEQHSDFFVRNLIVILCEERLAIVIQNGSAMVYGALSYAG